MHTARKKVRLSSGAVFKPRNLSWKVNFFKLKFNNQIFTAMTEGKNKWLTGQTIAGEHSRHFVLPSPVFPQKVGFSG